jgi:hypothetical protein
MEGIIDFDKWLAEMTQTEIVYYAIYNPDTNAIIGVYPDHAAADHKFKIRIDAEMARSIFDGEVNPSFCIVDPETQEIEVVESNSLSKIYNVLHRITEAEFSDVDEPDIVLTYDKSTKILKVELNKNYGGTFSSATEIKNKKIPWDTDTKMDFLFSNYNDPNIIDSVYSVKISDLVGNYKEFLEIDLPNNFSVYSNKLFKNYVIFKSQ